MRAVVLPNDAEVMRLVLFWRAWSSVVLLHCGAVEQAGKHTESPWTICTPWRKSRSSSSYFTYQTVGDVSGITINNFIVSHSIAHTSADSGCLFVSSNACYKFSLKAASRVPYTIPPGYASNPTHQCYKHQHGKNSYFCMSSEFAFLTENIASSMKISLIPKKYPIFRQKCPSSLAIFLLLFILD